MAFYICDRYSMANVYGHAIAVAKRSGLATTREAASRVGIHLATLQRWIATGKVKPPKPTLIGAVGYRLWSKMDIDRLERIKRKIYRRGRGRKQTGGKRHGRAKR